MCFVLSCCTGLAAKEAALVLSHQIMGLQGNSFSNSEIRDFNKTNSTATCAKALYYDSAVDVATTVCFLDFQNIRHPPRKTQ